MKKLLFCTLATFLAIACTKEDSRTSSVVSITAPDVIYAEIDEDATRAYIEDEKYLRWTEGDEISFFPVTYNMRYRYIGKTGDNNGSFEKLTTDLITGNELDHCYALYPYRSTTSMSDIGTISYEFPAVQHYAQNSFGLGANTMVAITSSKYDNILRFKNVGGYLKLKLYGENVTVKSIVFEGNNGEKVAGAATIHALYGGEPTVTMDESATTSVTMDCGDGIALGKGKDSATQFWLVLPATTFDKGFTITVTDVDDNVFTKSTSKSVVIERNVIQPMAELEVVMATAPTKPANNEIWYTTTDGKMLDLVEDRFGATITSHEQRDDMWVITFSDNIAMLGKEGSMYGAFESKSTLKSVVLPDGITKIGAYTFYKCSSLESIVLPTSLKTIGSQSIAATKMTSINIPANVTEIAYKAFTQTPLTTVNVFATTPPSLYDRYELPVGVTVYVPEASIKSYEQHAVWGYFLIKAL
ncbi:MAG: leucine-rich repeat domain-containing protein, partial [Alistipes sp.]|nr:leucine-rich repeat domain-containing protein [Alistipes sp.]